MDHFAETRKSHVVCLPFPAQGHINPMLKLSILLHHKGFYITFVNTEHNHRRLINSRGADSMKDLQDFQYETIPDGLPNIETNATQNIPELCESTRKNCLSPFRDLLVKINSSKILPPVTCIITDGLMSFGIVAAEEIGVPSVSFRTTNAQFFMCYKQVPHLVEKGVLPLKEDVTDEYMNTKLDWIPTMENVRLWDFPSFIRLKDINHSLMDFVIENTNRSLKASAMTFNTIDALESKVLKALSDTCPPIYSIGAIHVLTKKLPEKSLKHLGSNLWKDELECLDWLKSKEDKSVVYVNFGSITVMSRVHLLEFACGLANSKKHFLWIIRNDSVVDDLTTSLPDAFLEETKERGKISGWCPQEEVLNHRSIGVFLTHCGWNSMIESLACGVPMICWPFFSDQMVNCKFACTEWGVGIEMNNNVKKDEVEALVLEVIDGDIKGRKMRNKAIEWKEKIEAATATNGSSYLNLDKFVKDTLLPSQA